MAPEGSIDSQRFARQLAKVQPGRVRTWFVPDVVDTLACLESYLGSEPETPLLTVSWRQAPDIHSAIESIIGTLADVALARWADWYGEKAPFAQPDIGSGMVSDYDDSTIGRVGKAWPELDREWARQAVRCCRRGVRPVLASFPNQVQVRQLVLAIAPNDLIMVLTLDIDGAHPSQLLCFARAAAWIAQETSARVAAIVPAAYCGVSELDAITYEAVHVEEKPTEQPKPQSDDEPLRLILPPIIGQPHPASPGEQLLAQWLARDAELSPLFEFNQRVETSSGDSFLVDLLWRAGKMTVEVDGYGWHSSPHVFSSDRYRDYRLMCDGFRTLRLPHDEVMADPELQCEKIRDIVRMIRGGDKQ